SRASRSTRSARRRKHSPDRLGRDHLAEARRQSAEDREARDGPVHDGEGTHVIQRKLYTVWVMIQRFQRQAGRPAFPIALALLVLAGCGRQSDSNVTHLIDRFKQPMVKKSSANKNRPKPTELWNFADAANSSAWKAGDGVTGLTVRDG